MSESNYDVMYSGQDSGKVNEPVYWDNPENRIPVIEFNKREVWPSKMFVIKLELSEFSRDNPDIPIYDASQGDGGMSLGGIPPDELAEALLRFLPSDRSTKYGDPVGRADVRKAIFENYYGFDTQTGLTPDNIVIGDGGRDVLQKWYQVVQQDTGRPGDNIVVSAAPWASYPHGPYINCLNIIRAPGYADDAFKLKPDAIDACIEHSKVDGRRVAGLIITSPDNPTGNYMLPEQMISLVEHACSRGIPHIFVDLIYQQITDPEVGPYDVNSIFKKLSRQAQKIVCFMDGLTKSAGASNLRNAHLVAGSMKYANSIKGIATHTVIPNAIGEAAALEVYGRDEPSDHPWVRRVTEPTGESRRIVRRALGEQGYRFIADQGYYAFINIWPWLGKKIPHGKSLVDAATGKEIPAIDSVETLKSYLTTKCGLAVVHGSVFKQPHFIRFSYANAPEYTEAALMRFNESLSALE